MFSSFLNAEPALSAAFNGTGMIILLVCAAVITLLMVSRYHIFKKIGFSGGTGLIPFRSDFLLYRTFWNKKPFLVVVIVSGIYYFIVVIMLMYLIIAAVVIGGFLSAIYYTAGYKNGIPTGGNEQNITGYYPLLEIFKAPTIVFLVIVTVITLLLNVRMARAFGKGIGFAIGMTFIPVVFFPILAFDKNVQVKNEIYELTTNPQKGKTV